MLCNFEMECQSKPQSEKKNNQLNKLIAATDLCSTCFMMHSIDEKINVPALMEML